MIVPGAVTSMFISSESGLDGQAWNAATFGDGKYLTLVYNQPLGLVSADGITFSPVTLPQAASWDAAMWNGDVFCIIGGVEGVSAVSEDGMTWTPSTFPSSGLTLSNNGEAAIDGVFFVWAGSTLYTSPDGINWTATDNSPLVAGIARTVSNGTLYMVPCQSDGNVLISEDGVSWETSETPLDFALYAAAKGSTFCVQGPEAESDIVTTIDGIAYQSGSLPVVADPHWTSLCSTTNKFVIFNRGTNQYAHSVDGLTWTLASLPFSGDWNAFAANGTTLLISRTNEEAPHSTLITGL